MSAPGAIFSERAYALGKMLDHSAWQRGDEKLARGITPSDIDMVTDGAGSVIFTELDSHLEEWRQLDTGKRRMYEACIANTENCALMARHVVRLCDNRQIDTRNDIISFQAMAWNRSLVLSRVIVGNHHWQRFILDWTNYRSGPSRLRRLILDHPQDLDAHLATEGVVGSHEFCSQAEFDL